MDGISLQFSSRNCITILIVCQFAKEDMKLSIVFLWPTFSWHMSNSMRSQQALTIYYFSVEEVDQFAFVGDVAAENLSLIFGQLAFVWGIDFGAAGRRYHKTWRFFGVSLTNGHQPTDEQSDRRTRQHSHICSRRRGYWNESLAIRRDNEFRLKPTRWAEKVVSRQIIRNESPNKQNCVCANKRSSWDDRHKLAANWAE